MVTRKEIEDWVMEQGPEGWVNMWQPSWFSTFPNRGCGCLMVQYARDKHPECGAVSCGLNTISLDNFNKVAIELEFGIDKFITDYNFGMFSSFQYKELQKRIKEKYERNQSR